MTDHRAPGPYDVIIVGAGHNGLVTAAYLAGAGRRVLVLERRPFVGGAATTEDFGGGLRADAVWAGGRLRPDIARDLRLALPPADGSPTFTSLLAPSPLMLPADPARAAECIRPFSEKDARRWPEFVAFMNRSARFLDRAYATLMPRLPRGYGARRGLDLARLAVDLRLLGRRDMLNLIRLLPMTAAEFLEEWFESEPLKGALGSLAVHGATLGVMSPGTGFTLLHNWLNRGGLANANAGRLGGMTAALAAAAQSRGAVIRTEAEVAAIRVDNYT